MKIYGYKKNSDEFVELEEASVECDLLELDNIIKFLKNVKDEHNKVSNKTDICHSHYRDWCKHWNKNDTDIIVITQFNK